MNPSRETRTGSTLRAAERTAMAGARRVRQRELALVELYLMQISAHRGAGARLDRTDPLSSALGSDALSSEERRARRQTDRRTRALADLVPRAPLTDATAAASDYRLP